VLDLAHALQLSGPLTDDQGNPTVRGSLRDWAFIQMRGQIVSGMKGLAGTLTSRPAKATPPRATRFSRPRRSSCRTP